MPARGLQNPFRVPFAPGRLRARGLHAPLQPAADGPIRPRAHRALGAGFRRGVTLVELLIVISVLVVLAAVAVPTMQPALESRRIRETARALNVYLSAARNRAMETGRPCGVMLQRFTGDPACCMLLEQAEEPPAYGGDTITARAQVRLQGISPRGIATVGATLGPTDFNTALVTVGDRVRFNRQGPLYTVVGMNAGAAGGPRMTLAADVGPGGLVPWTGNFSRPVPYEVFRAPKKAPASPMQVPAGAAIDLACSGMGVAGQWASPPDPNDTRPVVIMFSPSGEVERVYCQHPEPGTGNPIYGPARPVFPIFLLVGKREKVGEPQDSQLSNWRDLTNLWVTINPRTGLVVTAENTPVDDPAVEWKTGILLAQRLAREAQSMGGR